MEGIPSNENLIEIEDIPDFEVTLAEVILYV